MKVPGYYHGGNQWIVRFSPDSEGTYTEARQREWSRYFTLIPAFEDTDNILIIRLSD